MTLEFQRYPHQNLKICSILLMTGHKTASTVISTQLKKSAFPILLGSDTKAEAATDRLLHPAIEIELKGHSRRK